MQTNIVCADLFAVFGMCHFIVWLSVLVNDVPSKCHSFPLPASKPGKIRFFENAKLVFSAPRKGGSLSVLSVLAQHLLCHAFCFCSLALSKNKTIISSFWTSLQKEFFLAYNESNFVNPWNQYHIGLHGSSPHIDIFHFQKVFFP